MKKSTVCYWTGSERPEAKTCQYTGPMLQEKAMQIAKALDVPQDEFKASNGWLDRFKTRNEIKAKVISGEAGDVSEDTVESWKERLPDILQDWAPQNIWNMNETGQFFLEHCQTSRLQKHPANAQGGNNQRKD